MGSATTLIPNPLEPRADAIGVVRRMLNYTTKNFTGRKSSDKLTSCFGTFSNIALAWQAGLLSRQGVVSIILFAFEGEVRRL
jgi:hypothetical protein